MSHFNFGSYLQTFAFFAGKKKVVGEGRQRWIAAITATHWHNATRVDGRREGNPAPKRELQRRPIFLKVAWISEWNIAQPRAREQSDAAGIPQTPDVCPLARSKSDGIPFHSEKVDPNRARKLKTPAEMR